MHECLRRLVDPTPTGFQKLTSCWLHLSQENRIVLFDHLKGLQCLGHLRETFYNFVLREDPSEYIKYQAAKALGSSSMDLLEKCDSSFVKYSIHETDGYFCNESEFLKKFVSLPHLARLACLRELKGKGELFAEIIIQLIQMEWRENKISKTQLWELVEEYLNRDKLKEYYAREQFDGWAEFQNGKDIEQIWSLVSLFVGDLKDLSESIILHAPYKPSLRSRFSIPEHILHSLDSVQLSWLFDRPDIELVDFRKEIFFREMEKDNIDEIDTLHLYVVAHNFRLNLEEFGKAINLPKNKRRTALYTLSHAADTLSMTQCYILRDLLGIHHEDGDDYVDYAWAIKRIDAAITRKVNASSQDSPENQNFQIQELQIYLLSQKLVPWQGEKETYNQNGLVLEDVWEKFRLWIDQALKEKSPWNVFLTLRKTCSCRQYKLFAPLMPVIEIYVDGKLKILNRISSEAELRESNDDIASQLQAKSEKFEASIKSIKILVSISTIAILWILLFR